MTNRPRPSVMLVKREFAAPIHCLLVLLFILSGTCLSGCKKTSPPSAESKIRVVVREGLEAEGIRHLAKLWGDRNGVLVDVQTLGRENYEINVTNDLLSPRPKYDVVFLPGTLVAEMAHKKAIASIDNWVPAKDQDLLTYSSYEGKPFGLPCDISSFFLFYRSDIVKSPPTTWHELKESVRTFASKAGGSAGAAYGFAVAGKAGEELPKVFYPILWSSGAYIIDGGRVGLDSDEAIQAATLFRDLARSPGAPPDIQTWDVGKIFDELQGGNVAISAPQWNALFPLIKSGDSDFRDRIQIAPLPGIRQQDGTIRSVNFHHTWVLAKSAKGSHKDLANRFVLYATGKEGARIYASEFNGNPARRSVLTDPALRQRRPEFALLLEAIESSKHEPEVAFYAQLHRIMNDALSAVLAGSQTPEAAMSQAAVAVRGLTE